jgi:hypothetical protein
MPPADADARGDVHEVRREVEVGQRAERRLVVDGDGQAQRGGERVGRAAAVEAGEVGRAEHDRRVGARTSAGRGVGPVRAAGRRAQQRGQGEADAEHAGVGPHLPHERGGAVEHGGRGEGPVVAGVPSVRAHHAVQPDRAHGERVHVDGHPERHRSARREPHGPRRPADPARRGRVLREHPGPQQRLDQRGHRGPGEPGARGQLGPRRAARGP